MSVRNPITTTIRAGDSYTWTTETRDGVTGEPINMTGATLEYSIAPEPGGTPNWQWRSDTDPTHVAITSPGTGKAMHALTPAETRAIPSGAVFEITLEYAPNDRTTIAAGRYVVQAEAVE